MTIFIYIWDIINNICDQVTLSIKANQDRNEYFTWITNTFMSAILNFKRKPNG